MKVEQLNNVQIDWTKPQVVVDKHGNRILIITNSEQMEFYFSGVNLETGYLANNWVKKAFKQETAAQYPIDLKLTIESDDELCNLLHRTSLMIRTDCFNLKYSVNDNDEKFQSILLDLVKERNLFKND